MNELDDWIEEAAHEVLHNEILLKNLLRIKLQELDMDYLMQG